MLRSAIGTICLMPPLLAAEESTPEWGQRLSSGWAEQENGTGEEDTGLEDGD